MSRQSNFRTDEKELLTLWLADQVTAVVAEEKEIADQVLNIAKQNINNTKFKI